VDSSEEELGLEDVAGDGVGGVVKLEERTHVGTEDCRVVVVEDCRTGGELKSRSHAGESHMRIFEITTRDSRRMHRSLYFQSSPSLTSHEAKQQLRS